MTAAQRLSALESLDAETLCNKAEAALTQLVEVMNRETTLLRAGHLKDAALLSGEKTQLSQDYVALARAVQRGAERLKQDVPDQLDALRKGHERLATQMADNLRTLATARSVTENLLSDVADQMGRGNAPKTYGARGAAPGQPTAGLSGLSVNRAS